MIPVVAFSVLMSVGQTPSLSTIRSANDASARSITSLISKISAVETEMSELPLDLERRAEEAQTIDELKAYQRALASNNQSLQLKAEQRYNASLATAKQNMIAVKERAKPAPVMITIWCDFSIPVATKQFVDLRDLDAIVRNLGLNETATGTLNKTHTDLFKEDGVIQCFRNRAVRQKIALNVDRERMILLGLLPLRLFDSTVVTLSSTDKGNVVLHAAGSDGTEEVFEVDPNRSFRIVEYTHRNRSSGDVLESLTASDYRLMDGKELIPFSVTWKRMKFGKPNSYSLISTVQAFELNPSIDEDVFQLPKGVQLLGSR